MKDKIDVFNPFAAHIMLNGISNILENTSAFPTPFLQILGARWLDAQLNDETGLTSTIWQQDQSGSRIIVTPDFFLADLIKSFGGADVVSRLGKVVVVFSDLPKLDSQWFKSAAMNTFLSARKGLYSKLPGFHYDTFWSEARGPTPVIPMGCAQSWLPITQDHEKIIFLDEPHRTLLDVLPDDGDIRVALFIHALETCKVLNDRGYVIYSFCRERSTQADALYAKYDFVRLIHTGDWIPFSELTQAYGKASLFFSFFTETFGYSIYENMQLGNGIVTYAETFDPYRLAHMQRGVLLSVYNSPRLSAEIVDEYYQKFSENEMRPVIRAEAKRLFSTETFFSRLRKSKSFEAVCDAD